VLVRRAGVWRFDLNSRAVVVAVSVVVPQVKFKGSLGKRPLDAVRADRSESNSLSL
jgi:hypothetical protein